MFGSGERVESEVIRQFKAEAERLEAEREAKSQEMRVASQQILIGKVNQSQKQAQKLADNLKQLEDRQHQDRIEGRKLELDLALEFNEHSAIGEPVSPESAVGIIKSVMGELTTDINSLNRSVSEMEKLVALAVKIKSPKFAKDALPRAEGYCALIDKTVNAIGEKLLRIARFGVIDDRDRERINCLTEIQLKAFGIYDDIRMVKQLWAEGKINETWLKSMHEQLKQSKLMSGEIMEIWKKTPKL